MEKLDQRRYLEFASVTTGFTLSNYSGHRLSRRTFVRSGLVGSLGTVSFGVLNVPFLSAQSAASEINMRDRLQAAIDALDGPGVVELDRMYVIAEEPVVIRKDGVVIRSKTSAAGITQLSWGVPALAIYGSNCRVEGGSFRNGAEKIRLYGKASGFDLPAREYAAGIFCVGGNNNVLEPYKVSGFAVGVRVAAYPENGIDICKGNVVRKAKFDGCDFGILINGQDGFCIEAIEGLSTDRSQGHPPHLIYFSAGNGTLHSLNGVIKDVVDSGNAFSGSFKFNRIKDSLFENLSSFGCVRGFDMADCSNLSLRNIKLQAISAPAERDSQQAGIGLDGCNNLRFSQISIDLVAGVNCSGVFISSACQKLAFDNLRLAASYSSSRGNHALFRISGGGSEQISVKSASFSNFGVERVLINVEAGARINIVNPSVQAPSTVKFAVFGVDTQNCVCEVRRDNFNIKKFADATIIDKGSGNLVSVN